jgi:hypothetical protein
MIKIGEPIKRTGLGKIIPEQKVWIDQAESAANTKYIYYLCKVKWENPNDDYGEYWMPYEVDGKRSAFSAIMKKSSLLELLQKAINDNLFDNEFIKKLEKTIIDKLNSN